MIVECGLIGLVGYGYYLYKTMDKRELINDFNKSMEGIGLYNKNKETFLLNSLKQTEYGWSGKIHIPKGLSVEHLNNKKNILEDNLNSIIEIEKDNFKDYINIYIINRDVNKYEFKPVKSKPYEIYIGKDFQLKDFKLNTRKDCHILIGGVTGTGKTFLLASILTNLIYNSSNKIEIYLLQVAKSELSAFENCNCVKESCFDINSCMNLLKKIKEIINKRSEKFKNNGIRNIQQWNKHYKKKYMKEIYVIIEELSFFLDCYPITEISKVGRSVGVHIISCIQRTVRTEMDSTLKSQMSRITFHQKSSIDSTNIIGTNDAVSLKERECIVDGNNDYKRIKTPWIDEDYKILNKYVPEIKIPQNYEKISKNTENSDIIVPKVVKTNKNFKEQKILTIEEHSIIDVKEEDIKEEKRDDGIMDVKEFNNAKRKRL